MQGSIKTIRDGVHRLRIDIGFDAMTGKRRQQMTTFHGTKKAAEQKLRDLLKGLDDGTYVEPSKVTLGAWLQQWMEGAKPSIRQNTYVRYRGIIDQEILKAPLASVPLQKLRSSHIEAYYTAVAQATTEGKKRGALSASTMTLHHTILHRALRKAVRDRLITTNPARDLEGRPRRITSKGEDARQHCWNVAEAQQFLDAAKGAGPQPAAFYTLGLDTGMRKGELCGLRWEDVALDTAKIRVVRQLLSPKIGEDGQPLFGPTKTGRVRTITISADTADLLRTHRKAQREQMMLHRSTYRDFGLVFAREDGQPLLLNNLGQREYAKLIQVAAVKPIKFHGLRHTSATLLLQAGTPVHVVSERLGHAKVSMTMEVYAHVLPDMQTDAAAAIGALLHRR